MASYDEKKTKKTYFRNRIDGGRRIELEEKHTTESSLLRIFFKRYPGVLPIKIETSILEKVLDFCERRGQIKKLYAVHDENLLQQELNHFDSNFRKQYQNQDDAIALVKAAARLDIKSLYDVLFEDVVDMIDKKTAQEIDNIFTIRYNGDDHRLRIMEHVLDTILPDWAWKEVV
uniref:uncharacterized protein LOC122598568 n=1 Tax=Erigeron canadensis TaxID=72917 RepID=UPI001CB8AAFE|nr:uncharacterized protein LOC122598568 [Erigeron canadensis]